VKKKKQKDTPRAVTLDRHAVTSPCGASASQPFFYATCGHMRNFLVSEGDLFYRSQSRFWLSVKIVEIKEKLRHELDKLREGEKICKN